MAEVEMSSKNTANIGVTNKEVQVQMQELIRRLEDIAAQIAGLVKRTDALEQGQQDACKEKEAAKSRDIHSGKIEPQESQTKAETTTNGLEDLAQTTEKDSFSELVDVREQVLVEGKMDWRSVESLKQAQAQRPFRYDVDQNAKLIFSVFHGSKLYQDLYRLCDPAHYGQVNDRDGRLEIGDLNPLLRAREHLEKMLEDLKYAPSNDPKKNELEALLQLYEHKEGQLSHIWRAQQRNNDMTKTKKVDWKTLKSLFRIHQLVVFRELRDEWAVARVTMVSSNEDSEYGVLVEGAQLQLDSQAIDFDGKSYRTHVYRKKIPLFTGTMNITELPVYPLEDCANKEKIWTDSLKSGKEWKRLHDKLGRVSQPSVAVMQYAGYCETFGEDAKVEEKGGKGSMISSRVIVDPARFPDRLLDFTEDNQDPFSSKLCKEKRDENLVLCPEQVLVHSLSDNEWYYVAMSKLKEPTWNEDAWNSLIKPQASNDRVAQSIKRVRDLAQAHQKLQESTKAQQKIDNFKGKGKGLTFLLHGSPGVEKTMLAESLSEVQQRPLYRINLGSLVGDYRWESRIEEIFRRAHSWDAILLVDEAEVVLAQRTQENMNQNAWVAVFLRKIEYFEGVIFLTTNLIHMIDPAFISRVNLGIKIPDLVPDTREKIWNRTLKEEQLGDIEFLEGDRKAVVRKWAEEELNGRQIRNVAHSARLMASLRPGPVTVRKDDINQAVEDVLGFKSMIAQEKVSMEQKYLSHWA